jgi:hypothetical protein
MGRRIRVTKIRLGAFGALTMTLALAAGVFAYFAATGSTTTFVSTGGAPSTWVVHVDQINPAQPGPITPGGSPEGLYVEVTNGAATTQTLNAVTATVNADANGGIFDVKSNASVDTCLASWFSVSVSLNGNALPMAIPAGGAIGNDILVDISMPASGTNQSACENLEPQVTINAS